jgi:predicted aminopeptidase
MEPEEFRRLQALARRRKTSVAHLIREAVRETYLAAEPQKRPIVEAILAMRLALPDWESVREELDRGHAGLS